ncbi:Holliday junction ATP-dependent DNA helicase RuvA [Clostridia bacterium]|nr:Holliday junction ATP-dependent DNA helicase RuvA [Clostridia bacterium]
MFNFIIGKIAEKTQSSVTLSCSGIGYDIAVTPGTLFNIREGAEVKLYTYLQVREDGLSLFGFLTKEEKATFLKLISISNVGPKLAMAVLSGISPRDLALCVIHSDVKILSGIKGVGKKTAERIILELKEKVSAEDDGVIGADAGAAAGGTAQSDAVLALAALGFTRFEAAKLVGAVAKPGMSVEEIITLALKGNK